MAGIATLIAAGLDGGSVARAADALRASGVEPGPPAWLEADAACDLPFAGDLIPAKAALAGLIVGCDIVVQLAPKVPVRLFVADMDSTMITVECIDELADYVGLKPRVAAITERAMRGELPFADALRARVGLLAGLTLDQLDACSRERVRPSPGARTLVATLRAHGVECLLVSGGFTAFAEPVAAELGFHRVVANVLEADGGRLTGRVLGPIVDGEAKRAELIAARERLGLAHDEVVAVGDGANDLPMVREAGLGVAYRAKAVLAEAADMRLERTGLDALLHVIGIPRDRWVET